MTPLFPGILRGQYCQKGRKVLRWVMEGIIFENIPTSQSVYTVCILLETRTGCGLPGVSASQSRGGKNLSE